MGAQSQTKAKAAKGLQVYYCNLVDGMALADISGASINNQIFEVVNTSPPQKKTATIPCTSYDSPDEYEEFVAGFTNAGEVELEVNYRADQAAAIDGLHGQTKVFKTLYKDGAYWKYVAIVTDTGDQTPREGIITSKITMKVSGKPIFTPAS